MCLKANSESVLLGHQRLTTILAKSSQSKGSKYDLGSSIRINELKTCSHKNQRTFKTNLV